jgi:lysophospholipase L1-like esterase
MMSRARRWLFVLSPIAVLLVLGACNEKNPTEPTPPADPNVVNYTAIGASDAIGFGSTMPCLPFADCPDGTGYVQRVTRTLRGAGKTVTIVNLGIPGATLNAENQSIGNSVGQGIQANILDQELPFVPRNSTLVTIFAGGNDIIAIGKAVQQGKGGADPGAYVQNLVNNFGRDIRALVSGVKDRAPSARIVILNLPNFAGLPLATTASLADKRTLQTASVAFSAQVNGVASTGALVIDLMCDQRSYVAANYSGDGFHPNDAGYLFLADLVYPVANTGSVTPPRGSCPQMTLF